MRRLEAKYLYAGDVLFGVGVQDQPATRTLTTVTVRDDGFVDLRFANGDKTSTQFNSTFSLEAYEVPIERRCEIRDDFRQAERDSQRQLFTSSRGQA